MRIPVLFLLSLTTAMATASEPDYDPVQDRQGKWGYVERVYGMDQKAWPVRIPHRYDWAADFGDKDDTATIEVAGKFGLIDKKGRQLVAPEYDWAAPFEKEHALVYRDGKVGVVNRQGKLIVPLQYERLRPFSALGLASAVKDGQWGVISRDNKPVVPFEYLLASTSDDGISQVFQKGASWRYFDTKGSELFSDKKYRTVERLEPNVYKVEVEPLRYEIVNQRGEAVVEGRYESVSKGPGAGLYLLDADESAGMFDVAARRWVIPREYKELRGNQGKAVLASTSEKKFLLFDATGKPMHDGAFDEIRLLDDHFLVKRKRRWGVVDKDGTYVLPHEVVDFKTISLVSPGLAARKQSGWGIVDAKGKVLLPFEYEQPGHPDLLPFEFHSNGHYWPLRHLPTDKVGLMKNDYRWTIKPGLFEEIDSPGVSGLARGWTVVGSGGKRGIYDYQAGKVVVPPEYSLITISSDYSTLWPTDGKRHLLINDTGAMHKSSDFHYDRYHPETERLVVEDDGRYQLLNAQGRPVTGTSYSHISAGWSEGEAPYWYAVEHDGKEGFIDRDGRTMIPFVYESTRGWSTFSGERARLKTGTGRVVIDRKNNVLASTDQAGQHGEDTNLLEEQFGNIKAFISKTDKEVSFQHNGRVYRKLGGELGHANRPQLSEGLLAVERDGKFGYLDLLGREVIPPQFDQASSFSGGVAYVRNGTKYSLINRKGELLKHADMSLALMMRFARDREGK